MTAVKQSFFDVPVISTHTPLARRDENQNHKQCGQEKFLLTRLLRGVTCFGHNDVVVYSNFYSHASCEAWLPFRWCVECFWNFYSHASCEAWLLDASAPVGSPDFYSHASCEAWHAWVGYVKHFEEFLLTRLLRGVTCTGRLWIMQYSLFLLTRLLRGVTKKRCATKKFLKISTHTPLARRDLW